MEMLSKIVYKIYIWLILTYSGELLIKTIIDIFICSCQSFISIFINTFISHPFHLKYLMSGSYFVSENSVLFEMNL